MLRVEQATLAAHLHLFPNAACAQHTIKDGADEIQFRCCCKCHGVCVSKSPHIKICYPCRRKRNPRTNDIGVRQTGRKFVYTGEEWIRTLTRRRFPNGIPTTPPPKESEIPGHKATHPKTSKKTHRKPERHYQKIPHRLVGGTSEKLLRFLLEKMDMLVARKGMHIRITHWNDFYDALSLLRIKGKGRDTKVSKCIDELKDGSHTLHMAPSKTANRQSRERDVEHAKRLIHEYRPSTAVGVLDQSTSLAEHCEKTLMWLKLLHPSDPFEDVVEYIALVSATRTTAASSFALPLITDEDMLECMLELKSGSAAGPSGLSAKILKQLYSRSPDELKPILLGALRRIVHAITMGRAPVELFNSRLVALNKGADGANGVRPIAVTEIFVRLAGLWVTKVCKGPLKELFGSTQMALQESSNEAIARLLEYHSSRGKYVLSTDFKNAFNEVLRKAILAAVGGLFPALLEYVKAAYGKDRPDASLFWGNETIPSARGVRQGDPISPLIFSLVVLPILRTLEREFPGLIVLAYHDDVYLIADSEEQLRAALARFITLAGQIGLTPKPTKCFANKGSYQIASHNIRITPDFTALGIPIGSPDYIRATITKKITKTLDLETDVSELDFHEHWVLLKQCISTKLTYYSRSVDPDVLMPLARQFDQDIMARVANAVSISPTCLTAMLFLPVWARGQGVPSLQVDTLVGAISGLTGALRTIVSLGIDIDMTHFTRTLANSKTVFSTKEPGWPTSVQNAIDRNNSSKTLHFIVHKRILTHLMEKDPMTFPWNLEIGCMAPCLVQRQLMEGLVMPDGPPRPGDIPTSQKISALYVMPQAFLRASKEALSLQLLLEMGAVFPSDLVVEGDNPICPRCQEPLTHGHGHQCTYRVNYISARHNAVRDTVATSGTAAGLLTCPEAHLQDKDGAPLRPIHPAKPKQTTFIMSGNGLFNKQCCRTDVFIADSNHAVEVKILNAFKASWKDAFSRLHKDVRRHYERAYITGRKVDLLPLYLTTTGSLYTGPHGNTKPSARVDVFRVISDAAKRTGRYCDPRTIRSRVAISLANANLACETLYYRDVKAMLAAREVSGSPSAMNQRS